MGLRPTHWNEKRNRRAFIDPKQVTECFSTVLITRFIVDPLSSNPGGFEGGQAMSSHRRLRAGDTAKRNYSVTVWETE